MSRHGFMIFQIVTEMIVVSTILLMLGADLVSFKSQILEFEGRGSVSGALGETAILLIVAVLLVVFVAIVFASIAHGLRSDG
ncbi:hypothetical protein [Salinigranum salinum]|uniref:hypothetical protein n=1 Tax=Salinigranum salinum TaxID=1364937 RepID=UPI001260B7B0|nr:hypothetical protein [Salinigranum salinum]